MGVYIKGMEMPKCCSECLFRSEFFTDETYGIAYGCNLNISIICHDEYKERKDDCPLDEVPDDGVVISEDEFRTYSRGILVALTLRDLLVNLNSFAEMPKSIEPVANAPADNEAEDEHGSN